MRFDSANINASSNLAPAAEMQPVSRRAKRIGLTDWKDNQTSEEGRWKLDSKNFDSSERRAIYPVAGLLKKVKDRHARKSSSEKSACGLMMDV